jgi:pyridoxal phosphate enzyme (YggS family)
MQQKYMFDFNKYKKVEEFIKNSGKTTKIIAVSKNHNLNKINEAISYGINIFGENRVQEAKLKFEEILKKNPSIKLHLTGPLQTNKVKQALDLFDVFHTLDREKLLKEFAKHENKINKKSFFIQVNTGKELSKSGVYPENVNSFLKLCQLNGIKNIQGLMCIPPVNENPKKHFLLLENISKDLGLNGLSIGMSSDYTQALEFNPLYIRLGTMLFGNRVYG